ncbi:AAA family ATPase [Candidatus Roizmanbacteria bacterium]|nr:AAA family ATPase [Candidatus Roizmanbacteria bacterium]
MKPPSSSQPADNCIRLSGIVERVTFHNAENGWSVLKVSPFNEPHKLVAVVIHQAKVFAGSSMDFYGIWAHHPQHGEQFKAERAIEKKPSTSAALEKYLGSGLIKNVGPKTAYKIVSFFKERTLQVFEEDLDQLLQVPGIAEKKLVDIKNSWQEHKAIRDVMIFLQGYGISTLYAVKIFKTYGNDAISKVSGNPYQLARDIYGIGFFSADKIALNMGFEKNGVPRIQAGIKHVLAASRDNGHCYLLEAQIIKNTQELLETGTPEQITAILASLISVNEVKKRVLPNEEGQEVSAYYANSLFFDEQYVAKRVKQWINQSAVVDRNRIENWLERYCQKQSIILSEEQQASVAGIASQSFSVLTGGPGVGKTTTTKVLVKLLHAMNKHVVLAAPTGRASQRMSEVIGYEAKTIHRLLEWAPSKNGFKKSEEDPLHVEFLIIDECSMLDINLAAALLKAVPQSAHVLFIGDPDQLPSVGAGNVLHDLLQASSVPSFRLTKVFRQAEENLIIRFAHQINEGLVPKIESPFHKPGLWKERAGCLFIDAEEATQEQLQFIGRAKYAIKHTVITGEEQIVQTGETFTGVMKREENTLMIDKLLVQEFKDSREVHAPIFTIPQKFKHVDLLKINQAQGAIAELKSIVKSIHPWSALHHGLTGLDMVLRLYTKTIPEYFGKDIEIQILSPQVRGSLGTLNLNNAIQKAVNPEQQGKKEIKIGDRIFRVGDRVIQTRNNYDLGVFNGDIGRVEAIDLESYSCLIQFGKQAPIPYEREDLNEISLAYAITIHKSQGSEFAALIIPVATQHFKMLFRNLIYTGLTRARQACVFVGSRKALAMAVRQIDNRKRQTALSYLIMN